MCYSSIFTEYVNEYSCTIHLVIIRGISYVPFTPVKLFILRDEAETVAYLERISRNSAYIGATCSSLAVVVARYFCRRSVFVVVVVWQSSVGRERIR